MNAINWIQNEQEITEENITTENSWLADWAEAMEAHEAEQAEKVEAETGTKSYYPEMKEERPEALIEAKLSHYGKHYFIYAHPSIPQMKGRGIVELENGTRDGSRLNGYRRYKVTIRAYEKIEAEHAIAYEVLLD